MTGPYHRHRFGVYCLFRIYLRERIQEFKKRNFEDYPTYFPQLKIEELSAKDSVQLFFSYHGEKEFHETAKKPFNT